MTDAALVLDACGDGGVEVIVGSRRKGNCSEGCVYVGNAVCNSPYTGPSIEGGAAASSQAAGIDV